MVGCGNESATVPVACEQSAAHLRSALVHAPGEVRLGTGTRLSQCFTRAADPAQIQQVAAIFIETAAQLADAARARPHSAATTQLGYLVGAVRHGASHTQGIYYETQRRIEQELVGVSTSSREFVRGERAGERTG
jgi:hypothetical protein